MLHVIPVCIIVPLFDILTPSESQLKYERHQLRYGQMRGYKFSYMNKKEWLRRVRLYIKIPLNVKYVMIWKKLMKRRTLFQLNVKKIIVIKVTWLEVCINRVRKKKKKVIWIKKLNTIHSTITSTWNELGITGDTNIDYIKLYKEIFET